MRMVFGLVLILGVGLAGFAVYLAQGYISQAEAKNRQLQAQMVPLADVYVLTAPLKYGDTLKPEHVRRVKIQRDALPENAFSAEEQLFPKGAKPRIVLRAMEKSEPLTAVKVTEPGEDAGITTRLAKGMRAFTIKVDVASGVSGFLRPGDKVDVYWTGKNSEAGGEFTKLIQTTIGLIAIDQSANQDMSGTTIARTVTVEATPQQVAALAQAQSTGRLSLALVGTGDDTIADTVEVNQRTLLGIQEAAPEPVVEVVEEKVCTIKTRKGGEVIETPIACTN